jgi:hypothetical protein
MSVRFSDHLQILAILGGSVAERGRPYLIAGGGCSIGVIIKSRASDLRCCSGRAITTIQKRRSADRIFGPGSSLIVASKTGVAWLGSVALGPQVLWSVTITYL